MISFKCNVQFPQIVFGNCGVLQANLESTNKGYVEMSNIDPETSKDIAEAMLTKGMRYLEVQVGRFPLVYVIISQLYLFYFSCKAQNLKLKKERSS